MKREHIKKNIREDKKRKIEVSKEFYDSMAVYCINEGLHMQTIYKLMKIKSIDQMLMTMREEVIKNYNLHEPTLEKLTEDKKIEINNILRQKGIRGKL